jgi:dTMP kinase
MFITLEGIDGCGKSTQAAFLKEQLQQKKKEPVLWTREPGGWVHGDFVRTLLLEKDLRHELSELFLFVIDRCEHVSQVISPALSCGQIVLCERYTDSSRAYQIWGRGLPEEKVEDLFAWCSFPEPDLTLWIDTPLPVAINRIKTTRGHFDRIESETDGFLNRVCEGYKELSKRFPHRIVRIDGSQPTEEVSAQIWKVVEVHLSK